MKTKIIQKAMYILLILFCVGFYLYQVFIQKMEPTENSSKFVLVVAAAILGLLRSDRPRGRRSLKIYEQAFEKELGKAFVTNEKERTKLIYATRYYNENNFKKSIKLLMDLKDKCQHPDDFYAVELFLALNYTDIEMYEDAISAYERILDKGLESSTIYNNMGHIYMHLGKKNDAIESFNKALNLSEDNEYSYANLANLHFEEKEFDLAIEYAEKTLEINSKLQQAASLLAIIYALKEDAEKADKYFHKAVACGSDPKELKQAINWYLGN